MNTTPATAAVYERWIDACVRGLELLHTVCYDRNGTDKERLAVSSAFNKCGFTVFPPLQGWDGRVSLESLIVLERVLDDPSAPVRERIRATEILWDLALGGHE